jgi:hypothetical protein
MAFHHSAPSGRSKKDKNDLVIGVGRRAYVNWSPPVGQPRCPVPMIDVTGKLLGNDLSDGQEVEILSWRPRSRDGLSYQIRRISDGSEWWISSIYLRRLATAALVAPVNGAGLVGGEKHRRS